MKKLLLCGLLPFSLIANLPLQQEVLRAAHSLNNVDLTLIGEKLYFKGELYTARDTKYESGLLKKWYEFHALKIVEAIVEQDLEKAEEACRNIPIRTMKADYSNVKYHKSTPPENAIKAFKAIINMNKWEYALILLIGIESLVPTTNDFNILWKAFSIQKGYAINEDGLIVHSSKPNIPILISENHPDASLIRLTKYAITRINLSQHK